ncbi:hypothetical protein AN644_04380 [Candidatus Epulonipiscium fishelsonii]|nr:hypothetical protein AN644_04380 [Epulopiscium sp. SCG-C06WGA-EpuloA1]
MENNLTPAQQAFKIIKEARAIVLSTVDKNGNPAARGVNCLGIDEDKQYIYFFIPSHKSVVKQIMANNNVAITTGMIERPEFYVRVHGVAEVIDESIKEEFIKRQPWFGEFFAKGCGIKNMVPFAVKKGHGEIFSMGVLDNNMETFGRLRFAFGGDEVVPVGHVIDKETCVGCKACMKVCPTATISFNEETNACQIYDNKCIECGICNETCPVDAISDGIGL